MSKTTWAEIIGSLKSDEIQAAADEAGVSYFEMERSLNNILKENERAKAYREKQQAAKKLAKQALLAVLKK